MAGFTKLFSSIVTSSIWVEDDTTLRVWIAMLATSDAKGFVAGSIPGFASLCRTSIEDMERSINILKSPDEYSRTKDNDGRRVADVEGGWLILNYEAYRNKGQDKSGSRAAYMRDYREKSPETVTTVTCNTQLLPVRTEAEAEADKNKRGRFTPPSLQEVTSYCRERANRVNPDSFMSFYESNGWKVGKNQMKDWKAAVRTWEQRDPQPKKPDPFAGAK